MKKQVSIFIIILLVLLVAILSVLNVGSVPVNFGFTIAEWPLILVILGSLLIGLAIMGLYYAVQSYQHSKKVKDLEDRLTSAEDIQKEQVEKSEYEYQEQIEQLEETINDKNQIIHNLERQLSNRQSPQRNSNEIEK